MNKPVGMDVIKYTVDSIQYYNYYRLRQTRNLFNDLYKVIQVLAINVDRELMGLIGYMEIHILKLNWMPWIHKLAWYHYAEHTRFPTTLYKTDVLKLLTQIKNLQLMLIKLNILTPMDIDPDLNRAVLGDRIHFNELKEAFSQLTNLNYDEERDLMNTGYNISINTWWLVTDNGHFTREFYKWANHIGEIIDFMDYDLMSNPNGIEFFKRNLNRISTINQVCRCEYNHEVYIPLDDVAMIKELTTIDDSKSLKS